MNHEQTPQNAAPAASQQDRSEILAHYLRTFNCESGRAVLRHLHTSAGTNRSSFHPGSNGQPMDALAAAKRDGAKTLVWFIEEQIAAAERAASSPTGTDKPPTVSGKSARKKR